MYGIGRRCGLDLVLLWLWCRPAATSLVLSPSWELPYDAGTALKRKKNNNPLEPICIESEAAWYAGKIVGQGKKNLVSTPLPKRPWVSTFIHVPSFF